MVKLPFFGLVLVLVLMTAGACALSQESVLPAVHDSSSKLMETRYNLLCRNLSHVPCKNNICCPPEQVCCLDLNKNAGGCAAVGGVCCPQGHACALGQTCCGSGCMPIGSSCCASLGYCRGLDSCGDYNQCKPSSSSATSVFLPWNFVTFFIAFLFILNF
eukprot:TRINITY_DN7082_c0_g1_i1.p1 TRINITY_DN7082_c0_g1~~TRINITY_DN7082_c0_g1_i1.p1  ORF type:complete len:160 (+),score=7.67 TRINITY_DN7082_c0_g1_i1:100-579(+)